MQSKYIPQDLWQMYMSIVVFFLFIFWIWTHLIFKFQSTVFCFLFFCFSFLFGCSFTSHEVFSTFAIMMYVSNCNPHFL